MNKVIYMTKIGLAYVKGAVPGFEEFKKFQRGI